MIDLLVLGGGPAGSAAAITAARAGLAVTVLERARFPRHRPGETLHPGVEPLLQRLDATRAIADHTIVRHRGTWVVRGNAMQFQPFGTDAHGDWQGYQLPRAAFDAQLLDTAASKGAQLQFGIGPWQVIQSAGRVRGVRAGSREWHARWVVDAAGDAHQLARQLQLRIQRCSPPLVARYGYASGSCPARDDAPRFAADEHGWHWSARIAPSLYQWTRVSRAHRPRTDAPPPELAALRQEGQVRGADVSWRQVPRCAGAGYFLVGDAAAVLDPSSSHGVMRALMCGMQAGHLASCMHDGRLAESVAMQHYIDWLGDWFAHDCQRLQSMLPS